MTLTNLPLGAVHTPDMLGQEHLEAWAIDSGAVVVHRAWRDGMLDQLREVPAHRLHFSALDEDDRDLDEAIAYLVAADLLLYLKAKGLAIVEADELSELRATFESLCPPYTRPPKAVKGRIVLGGTIAMGKLPDSALTTREDFQAAFLSDARCSVEGVTQDRPFGALPSFLTPLKQAEPAQRLHAHDCGCPSCQDFNAEAFGAPIRRSSVLVQPQPDTLALPDEMNARVYHRPSGHPLAGLVDTGGFLRGQAHADGQHAHIGVSGDRGEMG